MKLRDILIVVNLMCWLPRRADAHVSEQGFVLLLPTGAYTAAGVAVVALTVLALFVLPDRVVKAAFSSKPLRIRDPGVLADVVSLISLATLGFVIYLGLSGPRDPLSNLMPLGFWTVGWIGLVSLSGLFGNLWRWINPWTGLYKVLGPLRRPLTLPKGLGLWPCVALLIGFSAFLLADIAPDDPSRLARFALFYWLITFAGLILFGRSWLNHAELGHAIFAAYGRLAPVRTQAPARIGGPGWQLIESHTKPAAGLFALTLLATGSFDGLNETYWWLGVIGVNPLEFPGRSAVVVQTLTGLCLTVLILAALYALVVWFGHRLSRATVGFQSAFSWLALSLLPIALAYHIAHYLTSFLVSIQYTVAAISDPFANGSDWLRIQPFYVTTGFFNNLDTVRMIWITQASVVVIGHVWSVLLSHRIALNLFGDARKATYATLPLSVFMIGYTFLGLWLLAAPKGA